MNGPFIVKEHSKPKILSKNGGSYLMKLVHTMFYCKFFKRNVCIASISWWIILRGGDLPSKGWEVFYLFNSNFFLISGGCMVEDHFFFHAMIFALGNWLKEEK